MVTTEVGQLAGECTLWIDTLKSFKQKFTNHRNQLQQHSAEQTQHEVLLEIEHLHNQFHIQLINIHDLKQEIKNHERQVQFESSKEENASDELYARHEGLLENFLHLENTLQELRSEFHNFISATNC